VSTAALTSWDWLLIVVLGLSVAFGIWSGFLRTVFALAAWIAGAVAAWMGPAWLAQSGGPASPGWWFPAVLFIVVFLTTRVIGHLAARGVAKLGLSPVDRIAGAAFGVARGLLIVAVVVALARLMQWHTGPDWQQARSRPVLEWVLALVESREAKASREPTRI
jgi:membrane protein required for colicin V production